MKTIERAHSPAHMWEKIKLSNSYSKALEQVLSPHEFCALSNRVLDRQRTYSLAKFYNTQMQATHNQNHAVSYQNAKDETTRTVRHSVISKYFSLTLASDQNSSDSRKSLTGVKLSGSEKPYPPLILKSPLRKS